MIRTSVILVLFTLLSPALSCSCAPPPTFQGLYCRSKVSFRGTVIARTDNCPGRCHFARDQIKGKVIFIVRVDQQFKGSKVEDNIAYLSTAVNCALCGIELRVGTHYMFNLPHPSIRLGQCPTVTFRIGLCNYIVTWKSLRKTFQRFAIKNSKTEQSLCERGV